MLKAEIEEKLRASGLELSDLFPKARPLYKRLGDQCLSARRDFRPHKLESHLPMRQLQLP